VQLEDNEVSRRHAEVRRVGESFIVGDLKSSNGTWLNNRKIDWAELSSGDHIQVGRTILVYSRDNADEPAVGQVDIVPASHAADGSRIVRTAHDADAGGPPPDDTQNRWLARARSNLQVMYRTSLAVSHTLDIDDLLGRILQLVFEWVEADRGCIMLLDPESKQLRTKARRDRRVGQATSMAISRTILDYVLDRREGVLTSDAQDDDRDTPLLVAGARGHAEVARILLAAGADVRARNRYGGTALIPAAHYGHVETVRTLLQSSIDVNHVNDLGWTALLEAVILGDGGPRHVEIVRMLLAAGADASKADREGTTPLAHARRRGQADVVKLLEAAGAR
jgi:predicted component of type VI protein secretion system